VSAFKCLYAIVFDGFSQIPSHLFVDTDVQIAEVIVGYDGLRPEALSQPLQWHTMHKTYGEIQTTTRLAVAKPWSTLARSYGGLGTFKEENGVNHS